MIKIYQCSGTMFQNFTALKFQYLLFCHAVILSLHIFDINHPIKWQSDVTWFCIKRDICYLKFINLDRTNLRSQTLKSTKERLLSRLWFKENCPHNPTHFVKLHDYLFATTELWKKSNVSSIESTWDDTNYYDQN